MRASADERIRIALEEGRFAFDYENGVIMRVKRADGKSNPPKQVGLRKNKNGYPVVDIALYREKSSRQVLAHRLVWISAHGPVPEGMVIHHVNGDIEDYRLSNLVAVTQTENLKERDRGSVFRIDRTVADAVVRCHLEGDSYEAISTYLFGTPYYATRLSDVFRALDAVGYRPKGEDLFC